VLTFGCVPHTDDELTRARLVELCDWLAMRLDAPVRAHRAPSPAALASAFGAGRIDVAWVSPALFLTAPELAAAKPLVCSVRAGMALYHSVLFVREKAALRSPADLRGTRVAWVAPTSAAGYIVPRLSLASHGLEPQSLFSAESFHDSHGNVARAVMARQADVGATYCVFEGGDATAAKLRAGFDEAENGAERARILYAAGPIPSDPIVAGPRVTATARVQIAAAFADAAADPLVRPAILHILGADAFEAVRPHAFDELREQIRVGREHHVLDDA
jgi:phosphonate transport system substrate-binding protein